jgi:hypothetical protein
LITLQLPSVIPNTGEDESGINDLESRLVRIRSRIPKSKKRCTRCGGVYGLTGLTKADTRPDSFVVEAAAVTTLVDKGIAVEGGGVMNVGSEITGVETVVVVDSSYSL